MNQSDFKNLPVGTQLYAQRLVDLGFDRTRVFGLFVMLGIYVGGPNTQEKIDAIFSDLQLVLPIDRTLDVKKTNAAQNARQIFEVKDDFFQNQNTLAAAAAGGGRHPNIKEVQKGGAAAAKRAQDSIKQFLSSSVTSSHILNMVKRKTKAKRKRNEKRSKYSRKRARK